MILMVAKLFIGEELVSTVKPLKSELIGAKVCSDFSLFRLAVKYTQMTEGDYFGVWRVSLTTLTGKKWSYAARSLLVCVRYQ